MTSLDTACMTEQAINEYLCDYTFDDVGGYRPTGPELDLIKDAIMGLLVDQNFLASFAPLTEPELRAATESDDKFAHMRHPDVQRVIGQQARTNIELQLVEQLLEDPNFETTSMDMEYWSSLHDKLKAALTSQPADVRIPTSDAQVLAMAQQFNRETP